MTTPIRNWSMYNKSLVDRGDITLWLSPDSLNQWKHSDPGYHRGRPYIYSDTAIESLLIIREVFHLTLRGTEGFARSLFKLLEVNDQTVPDYTLLCKRAKTLNAPIRVQNKGRKLDLLVDSAGLKVYGEGEWNVRKHGKSKRRHWVKVHIAVDSKTQQITAVKTTSEDVDDAEVFSDLIDETQGKVRSVRGDGAYDKRKVYVKASKDRITPIIPPRKNGRKDCIGSWGTAGQYRNEAIDIMRDKGIDEWKKRTKYGKRSLVESTMNRLKSTLGEKCKSRNRKNQITEMLIKVNVLNMTSGIGLASYF